MDLGRSPEEKGVNGEQRAHGVQWIQDTDLGEQGAAVASSRATGQRHDMLRGKRARQVADMGAMQIRRRRRAEQLQGAEQGRSTEIRVRNGRVVPVVVPWVPHKPKPEAHGGARAPGRGLGNARFGGAKRLRPPVRGFQ